MRSVVSLSLVAVVLLLGSFASSVNAITATQLQAKASGTVRTSQPSASVPSSVPAVPSPESFISNTLNLLTLPNSEFQQRLLDTSAVFDQLAHHAARASKAAVSTMRSSYSLKRHLEHTQSVMTGGVDESIVRHTRELGFGINNMPAFDLSPAQQQQVTDAYATDPKALGMRNKSPRFRGNTGDTSTDIDYIIGMAIYFGIGVVIGTLNLLCTGLYMFCRCCCWRWCCKKQSDHEMVGFPGYLTFTSKYWPVLLLAAFVPLACAFAIVGITYNNSLSRTFSASDQEHGIGPLALNAIADVNAQINNIETIASNLVGAIPTIAANIAAIMPTSLQPDSTALKANATQFGVTYASPVNVQANQTTWSCTVACSGITASSTLFVTAINSQVQPAIDSLQSSVDDVQRTFLDSTSSIQTQLNDATSSLNDATSVFDQSLQNTINDNAKTVEKYDKIRNSVFLALFSLVFLSPLLTVLGLMLKRGCPFKCTFCLGPFYCWIIFFLFGLHWLLGMLIGDACVYLDTRMVNVAAALDGRGGTALPNVLNACFTSTSLVTALALEQQLNFSNIIQFPPPLSTSDINQKFTIPALDNMVAAGHLLTTADWGLDETSTIDNRLTTMSGLLDMNSQTHSFTRTNLPVNADSSTFSSTPYNYQPPQLGQIVDLYNNVEIALNVSRTIQAEITRMNNDINNLVQGKNKLQSEFQAFSDATNQINTTLTPALNAVDQLRGINCGKIAQDFGAFKNTFCNNLGNSLQFMTLAMFFVSFSCCGIAWFSRWSSYRVDFVPRIAPAAFDEQAWMVANGYAPAPAGQVIHNVPAVQMAEQPAPTDAGTAMNVPSYEAALASYKQPEQFQTQSPDDQFGMEKPNDWSAPIQPQETNEAAFQSAEEAAGVAASAEVATEQQPAETAAEVDESPAAPSAPAPQICESCEKELVSIHCDECEEDLCVACDDGLHKSAANQGHTRRAL